MHYEKYGIKWINLEIKHHFRSPDKKIHKSTSIKIHF